MGMQGQSLGLGHYSAAQHRCILFSPFSFKLLDFGTFSDQSLNSLILNTVSILSTEYLRALLPFLPPLSFSCSLLSVSSLFQVSHSSFRTFTKHLIFVPIFCHTIDLLSCSLCCQRILRSRQAFPKGL